METNNRATVPVEVLPLEDSPWFWKGTCNEYAELLARAYDAIKAADPGATVLPGGLAQGGGAAPDFLESILADPTHPAGQYFDLLNYHTNFRSMGGIVEQIKANRDALERHALSKQHWITETSYTSDRLHQTQPGYQDGKAGQVRYLVDAFTSSLNLASSGSSGPS